jgi:hypothetical protein
VRIVTALLRVVERLDFCVRSTRAPMPAAPDVFAALHQHRADHWIGRSLPATSARQIKGVLKEFQAALRFWLCAHF